MSIALEHVNYVYSPGTAYEKHALKDVSFEIEQGQFVGIIGHTGSGKSTLIQHLNGLVKATSGKILYEGQNIYEEGYDMKKLRSQVGLVFQYPEYQLFEADVLSDVCFGPKNQGLSREECEKCAGSLRLSCPGDRSGVLRSRGYWRCIRGCWCLTSRRRGLIRRGEMRSSIRSSISTGRRG